MVSAGLVATKRRATVPSIMFRPRVADAVTTPGTGLDHTCRTGPRDITGSIWPRGGTELSACDTAQLRINRER